MFLRFCWKLISSVGDYCINLCYLVSSPVFKGKDVPPGYGRPVFVIPGFLIGDISMFVIRSWLTRMGYQVHASGSPFNKGCPYSRAQYLERKLIDIHDTTGQPVVVIGYSLGGAMARFLAYKHPNMVQNVITISPPSIFDTKVDPVLYLLFRKFNPGCVDSCDCELIRELKAVRPVDETLIYSRDDRTVMWDGPRPVDSPSDENCHEVSGTHGGLVVNPDVYRIIASNLHRA